MGSTRLFPEALEAFRAALGHDHVVTRTAALDAASRATFATSNRVSAILKPGSRADVQACLRIANQYRTPLHPVSRGRNWGYGTAVPFAPNTILLDLSRMNRIISHDDRLGYVVLEPGVSIGQLIEHLNANQSTLFASIGGAPPEASFVGNALERGMGKSRFGDRFEAICGLEVVLPSGEVVETGYGRFPNAKANNVARASIGPYVDGLFSQSNFGVVTRMTMWLPHRSPHFRTFFYSIDHPDRLPALVDAVQSLYARDILRTPTLLGNDYRWLSFVTQYPWQEMKGVTPLAEALVAKMRKKAGRGVWNGDGALYGESHAHVRALQSIVEATLSPIVSRIIFFDPLKARLAVAGGWIKYLATGNDVRRLMRLAFSRSIYQGNAIEGTLATLYWRKKTPPPTTMDPDRDGCGLIAYDMLLPATGKPVVEADVIVRRECGRFGFEPNIALNFGRGKAIYMTGQLLFDRDVAGEDERALACHDALIQAFASAGYYPCRLGVMSNNAVGAMNDPYTAMLAGFKKMLDPNGILSPGKLSLPGLTPDDSPT